jgi:TRAP-type C4-dicarboxylate transport system permease small subunit
MLTQLSNAFGVAGAGVALCVGFMTTASVIMRALWDTPIPGDVELTQIGIALAISLCLPVCQLRRANILVDFFTERCSGRTRQVLDGLGCWLLVVMYGLLAWRTGVGAIAVRSAGETTMIISLPMWWAYASLAPGLALAALIAWLQGWRMLVGAEAPDPDGVGAAQ